MKQKISILRAALLVALMIAWGGGYTAFAQTATPSVFGTTPTVSPTSSSLIPTPTPVPGTVVSPGTTIPGGTIIPGVPNTGAGGDLPMNLAVLAISALVALVGAGYALKHTKSA